MSSLVIPDPVTTDWVPLGYGASIQSNVPAARIFHSANQNVVSTGTQLTFDSERFDTDNIHDPSVNPQRLTCKTPGKYLIGANIHMNTSAAPAPTECDLQMYMNGGSLITLDRRPSISGYGIELACHTVYDCIVGDYFTCTAQHNSTSTQYVYGGPTGQYACEFWMIYIGPGFLGRGQQNLVGAYLNRPAANTVPPGTTYFAYDALGTWLSDGSQWYLVNQRPAFGAGSILGQAPWTTPYDGMEVMITDAFSNPAYMWHFRYNGGSSSAYKWEFIGGTPYLGYSSANQTVNTVNTWTNIVASAIAPPRSGEFVFSGNVQASHPTAGATGYAIFWVGSLPGGIFGPGMAVGWPNAGGYSHVISLGPIKQAITSGNGVGVAAQNNIAGGNFSLIQWSMIPTRIS